MTTRGLLVLLLAAAPLLGAAVPASAQSDNPWLERRFLNIAHRGGRAEAPEHTMYAYRTALRSRATVLEIDVYRSADGVLVVSHDATVDRVTSGSGPVASMTLAELKALDGAYWFSSLCEGNCGGQAPEDYDLRGVATGTVPPPAGFAAADFQIPTMREVLEAFPDILMSIEIKGTAPSSVPAAEDLADLLTEFGRTSDVMIASFDAATTAAFKARAPEIHTTPAQDEILAFVGNPGPLPAHRAFQVPRTFQSIPVAPLLVSLAHANDLPVYFFINPSEETPAIYTELLDQGADGIITDRPSALQAVLDERRAAYFYPQPLPTQVAVVKTTPLVKFVAKAPVVFPRFLPAELPNSLLVESNGGELFDPLTAGTWTALGRHDPPKGYRYVNRAAPAGGACRLVVIKETGIKATCQGRGTIPNPLAAGMNDDVTIGLVLGIDRYCAVGTAPHRTEKLGKVIKVKQAPAPASCTRTP
jgi:glycerophosphoryl diester phosphodiesterase